MEIPFLTVKENTKRTRHIKSLMAPKTRLRQRPSSGIKRLSVEKVGTKMRPSDFFGDGTDACRDGNDLRYPENLKAVFTRSRSSRAYFRCSERMRYGWTDGRTNKASYRYARTRLKALETRQLRQLRSRKNVAQWKRKALETSQACT